MSEVSEPQITINGVPLTQGQAMTLRVAASSFARDLRDNGLGDDEHGKAMTAGYLARLREILQLMHQPISSSSQADTLICKCGTKKECLGGRSAHISNWYCPKCEAGGPAREFWRT